MATGILTIDISALRRNWRDLDALSPARVETGAVVKADCYGLGVAKLAPALAAEGARSFFVASAEEGGVLRRILGPGPRIFVFSGHMMGDTDVIRDAELIPLLNSLEQMLCHVEALPGTPYGLQLDTGMNRLGIEPAEFSVLRAAVMPLTPELVMSHLACADEPAHTMNAAQRRVFEEMTEGLDAPRSLSATGGTLLGPAYHYDLVRPGIGLYGGLPHVDAWPVVALDLPVIQIRDVSPGETVGYGNSWTAPRPSRIATLAAGYADGLIRAMGPRARFYAGETRCPLVGRVSMDMIGLDVTDVPGNPETIEVLGQHQSVDSLADAAGTIGYEILTSLGGRYARRYLT